MTRFKRFSTTLLQRVFMVSMVAAAILGWTAQNAVHAGNADLWKVDKVKGTAWVQRNGAGWQPLASGAELGPGSRVKTGKDGRIVISRPGDRISVSPNSRFGIPKGPVPNIMQNLGTLLFRITNRPQNPFHVETPYLAAIIRGTTFTVSVDDRNASLHVDTGAVEVHSFLSGETALVRRGETATIDSRTGGRMKLVGANGRMPVKKTNKTDARGKTGKAASAVQQTANTEAGGAGGETSALKSAMKAADRLFNTTGSSSGSAGNLLRFYPVPLIILSLAIGRVLWNGRKRRQKQPNVILRAKFRRGRFAMFGAIVAAIAVWFWW